MTVLARDQVAADHLVYAWPFPIGPDCEVSCADDEQVVMCPAWVVGDRLGPGRHHWRSPDPSRPVAAYFVRTSPVDVLFDMVTSFLIPATGMPVRLRASGILQVRCADPSLLVAQFVGLPFDTINDGVMRSVSRSVERMIARLLTRRVVMAGTPLAVTDPSMLPGIVEELVAYNPTAGAVFGVDLLCVRHLSIAADDGSSMYLPATQPPMEWSGQIAMPPEAAGVPFNSDGNGHHVAPPAAVPTPRQHPRPPTPRLDTDRGIGAVAPEPEPAPVAAGDRSAASIEVSGEIVPREIAARASSEPPVEVAGEIVPRSQKPTMQGMPPVTPPGPVARIARPIEVPRTEETTLPLNRTKIAAFAEVSDGAKGSEAPDSARPAQATQPAGSTGEPSADTAQPTPGAAVSSSSAAAVSGEIGGKSGGKTANQIAPGGRVLVPGPHGLMQSATVRQLVQGYYELEVGHTGETIWVPMSGVVPE